MMKPPKHRCGKLCCNDCGNHPAGTCDGCDRRRALASRPAGTLTCNAGRAGHTFATLANGNGWTPGGED